MTAPQTDISAEDLPHVIPGAAEAFAALAEALARARLFDQGRPEVTVVCVVVTADPATGVALVEKAGAGRFRPGCLEAMAQAILAIPQAQPYPNDGTQPRTKRRVRH